VQLGSQIKLAVTVFYLHVKDIYKLTGLYSPLFPTDLGLSGNFECLMTEEWLKKFCIKFQIETKQEAAK
jgi:hypothetical protein